MPWFCEDSLPIAPRLVLYQPDEQTCRKKLKIPDRVLLAPQG